MSISILTSLFRAENYLPSFLVHLQRLVALIDSGVEIEVLLLHNIPSTQEMEYINAQLPFLPFVRHIIIDKREPLYATWNRGIQFSNSEYCTVWNVDDVRNPEGILAQKNTLDSFPDIMMTYGDMYGTDVYGEHKHRLHFAPEFELDPIDFTRSHHVGCFPMWRRSVHSSVGYFDENFKIVGDFDFQVRLACAGYKFKKTYTNLGYYLENQPTKLSGQGINHTIECTAVELRYGIYDKVDLTLVRKVHTQGFHIDSINNFGKLVDLQNFVPTITERRERNKQIYKSSLLKSLLLASKRVVKSFLMKVNA